MLRDRMLVKTEIQVILSQIRQLSIKIYTQEKLTLLSLKIIVQDTKKSEQSQLLEIVQEYL